MARPVGIGHQDFEKIRLTNNFYVDKTNFIKEWWEANDVVTLITRPRRFGKTLNMSMIEKFFSTKYADRTDLFEGLSIWNEEKYRKLQGTYPVLFISFANVKENTYTEARKSICMTIEEQYNKHDYLLDTELLNDKERAFYQEVTAGMSDITASAALRALSDFLERYYGKKVIILLDEYDTPMQEAYVSGYWDEMTSFIRTLFNSTFKANPFIERAIMTGITRVSKETIFSDLNNLEVVTTTSKRYADFFGLTEDEVFESLEEFGLADKKQLVKDWYDGFIFGDKKDIYNPWSIINFLAKRKVGAYWANSSSNNLVSKLIREGTSDIKKTFEYLLQGKSIQVEIDEQIVYNQLSAKKNAVWSLLLASGYMKAKNFKTYMTEYGDWKEEYELELTNFEVRIMFRSMVRGWFDIALSDYNDFIKALLLDDIKAMNIYMNKVSSEMFSYFDTGKGGEKNEPERFYHGFVLGLIVDLADKYVITSNRESGYGRYDVMLEPRTQENDAVIIEFKVQGTDEKELTDTVHSALQQIEEKNYKAELMARGILKERIRCYGFAFCGKKVLIDGREKTWPPYGAEL